jgi:lipoprotein-anchoring transpeptidase ErfK/SrfK
VGVGQPIVLTFTHSVSSAAARQAVLSHLKVAMSTPVPIGAYWFSSHELHLRPQTYWPSGERVSFSDNLEGWDAGSGMWGQGSLSVAFATGDARISTANLATHEMTVTDNGKVVTTYPISAGRDQYPTMNGIHLVLDRESKVQMISSTVGIPTNSPNGYNETVYWDVHISDSGEYVHAAPWSVGAQGSTNVSHGCINISTANAEQFFNFSRVGDIVQVVGGPRAPVAGDHGVMDWSTAWSAFTAVPVTKL